MKRPRFFVTIQSPRLRGRVDLACDSVAAARAECARAFRGLSVVLWELEQGQGWERARRVCTLAEPAASAVVEGVVS